MGDRAVAKRWAEALYALAKDQGRQQQVLEELVELKRRLDADPQLRGLVFHPRRSAAEKEAVMNERLFADRDHAVCNTVRLMVRKRRLAALHAFFGVYLEVHEAREGILRVRVETASPLGEEAQAHIEHRLHETTGRPVILETEQRPELLGGMRLVMGSEVVDGSVRGRLDRLRRRLSEVSVG
jgi:F-type H+-transporting ATPase subunit delta